MRLQDLFLIFLFTANSNWLGAQTPVEDSLVIAIIKSGSKQRIDSLITSNGINKKYFNNSHTILTLAISQGNFQTAKYIVDKGADLNLVLKNNTPLIVCAIYDKDSIAEYMLQNGAKVDLYNLHKNTALLYSARLGSIKTLKVLLRHRANPFMKNFKNYNSIGYAEAYGKTEVVALLSDYMQAYARGTYPSCYDGPHVERLNRRFARVFYLVNDSLKSKVYTVSRRVKVKDELIKFKGFFDNDTLTYTVNYKIKSNLVDDRYIYNDKKNKIFVIGDVHGACDSLVKLLMNNGIIDQKLNWVFGTNHLVFIGDLVDRGSKVTEVLWLLSRLIHQSNQVGGKVHILIGNHELLVMNNDNRYLNQKYQILTRGNGISYTSLFEPNVWPGTMLRYGKSAIIVDSILFVHAGISKTIAGNNLSLTLMNQIVEKYLIPDYSFINLTQDQFLEKIQLLFSKEGIFWYRGYILNLPNVAKATIQDLESVLIEYRAKSMIIGHTEVDSIWPTYNNKLFPINVPFHEKRVKAQGLLIDEKRNFWRCYIDGSKEKLK